MTTDDLTRDGLGRSLFRMTLPMLFGVLSLMSYQLVDSAFIGQLGVDPLAALGFTLPMQQLIIGAQVGLGIATTALLSRAMGAGDADRAQRMGGLVVIVGGGLILLVCALLWTLRAPLMNLLGAEPALLPLIRAYWIPWLISAWLGAMLYFGYSIARAHGNTRLPGLLMVTTSLLNIVLDPLYIFVLGWGLPGAAWATITAFSLGILCLYPPLLGRHWLRFDLRNLRLVASLRSLSGMAVPAMLSQLAPPLSASLATALVAGFGATAVAAWGLGTRLEFFSIVVVLALTMSMPPMVGRFLGANDIPRIRALVSLAVRFIIVWQLAVSLLWLVLSGTLSSLLTQDAAVADTLRAYLLRVPLSFSGLGVCMLMVSVCNALGMPLRALSASVARLFVCYLPALWIGAWAGGLTGLFTGAAIGNVVAGLMAWSLYRRGFARLTARQAQSGNAQPCPSGKQA